MCDCNSNWEEDRSKDPGIVASLFEDEHPETAMILTEEDIGQMFSCPKCGLWYWTIYPKICTGTEKEGA